MSRRGSPNEERWGPSWERVARAEREHWILTRDLDHPDARKLSRIEGVLRSLWGKLADGEDIGDRVDELYRAATGHRAEADAQIELLLGLALAAAHVRARAREGRPTVSDNGLVRLVIGGFERAHPRRAARLEKAMIVEAVKAWSRGRGRPRRGTTSGSKWAAAAALIEAAGLGSLDERAVENVWERRRRK